MNLKHIRASVALAAAALIPALLSSCDGDLDRPPLDIPSTTMEANTTILDFKKS